MTGWRAIVHVHGNIDTTIPPKIPTTAALVGIVVIPTIPTFLTEMGLSRPSTVLYMCTPAHPEINVVTTFQNVGIFCGDCGVI